MKKRNKRRMWRGEDERKLKRKGEWRKSMRRKMNENKQEVLRKGRR